MCHKKLCLISNFPHFLIQVFFNSTFNNSSNSHQRFSITELVPLFIIPYFYFSNIHLERKTYCKCIRTKIFNNSEEINKGSNIYKADKNWPIL